MPRTQRRQSQRKLRLLTAYRCLENGVATTSGFVSTTNVDETGALLESPDPFSVGQHLSLEFLLDDDCIAQADGHVTRITKGKVFYRVQVAFSKVSAKARRLLVKQ